MQIQMKDENGRLLLWDVPRSLEREIMRVLANPKTPFPGAKLKVSMRNGEYVVTEETKKVKPAIPWRKNMKSVFIVSPVNSDEDVKWGIWVTNARVRNVAEALDAYDMDNGEEETAYYGTGEDERYDQSKAVEKAKKVAMRIGARKRIVVI